MARVLVDTSAIYALVDRDDVNHTAARASLKRMKKRRDEPFITNFIVAETHALLLARVGPEFARRWLAGQIWPVEPVTRADEEAAHAIIQTQTDKTYSYTDACSF